MIGGRIGRVSRMLGTLKITIWEEFLVLVFDKDFALFFSGKMNSSLMMDSVIVSQSLLATFSIARMKIFIVGILSP
jgi:hypothetical protein